MYNEISFIHKPHVIQSVCLVTVVIVTEDSPGGETHVAINPTYY